MRWNPAYALKRIFDFAIAKLSNALPLLKATGHENMLGAVEIYSPQLPVNLPDIPATVSQYFYENIKLPSRNIFVLRDVVVSWHAVVLKNFRIFLPALSIAHWKDFYTDSYLLKQWLDKSVASEDLQSPVALVHDQWTRNNYYHWMIDALSRLLALRQHHPNAVLLMPEPSSEYVRQTAALLGFNNFIAIAEKEVVKANTLLVPDHVAAPGLHNPSILRQLRAEITNKLFPGNTKNKPVRRIYVSRSRQKVRRLSNEEEVMNLLQKYDFERVYFEELSFIEQVELMQNTAVLIGVHGANLVNLMFMQPGSCVIELINEDKFIKMSNANFENLIYYRMSSSLDLPYFVVLGQAESAELPSNDVDIIINVSYLNKIILDI